MDLSNLVILGKALVVACECDVMGSFHVLEWACKSLVVKKEVWLKPQDMLGYQDIRHFALPQHELWECLCHPPHHETQPTCPSLFALADLLSLPCNALKPAPSDFDRSTLSFPSRMLFGRESCYVSTRGFHHATHRLGSPWWPRGRTATSS